MRAVLRGLRGAQSSPGRRLPVTMSSVSSRKVATSSTTPSSSAAASRSAAAAQQQRSPSSSQKHAASAPPSSSSSAGLKKIAQMYMDALAQRPMLTKSVTCFVGGVLGDLLAQQTTGLPFDAARNLRLATFGLVFGGPAGHLWHRALDARFVAGGAGGATRGFSSSSSPSSSQPRVVLSKLACDQLLFAPVATALLFVFLKITEGGTPAEAAAFCAENWWRTLKANWMLWPAANLIAFAAIPQDLRILYSNAVGVAWCAYVSLSLAASAAATGGSLPPPPPPFDAPLE